MDEDLEDITECSVCFEAYDEGGDRVPRLLPCTHTLCEKCVRGLLKEKSLRCPECRMVHPAPNEILTFPQNKYILIHIRKVKKIEAKEQRGGRKKRGPSGKVSILTRVEDLRKNLERQKQTLLDVKNDLEIKRENCMEKMKKSQLFLRTTINEAFGEIFKTVSVQARKAKWEIDRDIATINENILLLDSIRKNSGRGMLAGDAENRLESLDVIQETLQSMFTEQRTYTFFDYNEFPREEVNKLCGHLTEKETVWRMPDTSFQEVQKKVERRLRDDDNEGGRITEPWQTARNPRKLKCKVTHTVRVHYTEVRCLCVHADNRFTVYGHSSDKSGKPQSHGLSQYDSLSGLLLRSVVLPYNVQSMTDVLIYGKPTLILSYVYTTHKLALYDVDTLEKLKFELPVGPDVPLLLSTGPDNSLLYTRGIEEDTYASTAENKYDVRRVDLSEFPQWFKNEIPILLREFKCIHDICIIPRGHGDLIIITADSGGIFAYNARNGHLEWKITRTGKLPKIWPLGVSYDNRGHLFVCDKENGCIKMFSVEGEYLGVLLSGEIVEHGVTTQKGKQGLGNPRWIRWDENSSSLVLIHVKGLVKSKKRESSSSTGYYISVIKIE